MVLYFDTSALLKHYVTETGTGWVNTLLAASPMPLVFTSQLTVVEVTCALARRLREGTLATPVHATLSTAFDYDIIHKYHLVELTQLTLDTARQLANKHPLRAYDAMHLATAWLIQQELQQAGKPSLTFMAADNHLVSIAQAEGLLADDPNRHP